MFDEAHDADDEDVEFADAEGDDGQAEDDVVVFWVVGAVGEGDAGGVAAVSPVCADDAEPDVVDETWDDEVEEDDDGPPERH